MVDQNSQFYAILTNVGAAKQANADALGIPWKITQMGVGDANGTDPTPNATQTSLVNEWRRAPLNQLKVDDKDASIIVAEQVIPADVGGRWIREIGLYDADGDLIAVANCAPTYKPLLSQGSGRTQVVRMNLVVSSASSVQLKIDPSVVLATREWVSEELARQDFKHSVVVATTGPITLSGLQTVDGVVLDAGARVLVRSQAAAKDNGLYVAAVGAWARCTDADTSAKVTPGLLVHVERGTANGDSGWQLVTDGPITLGVTALAFEMAWGRTGVTAGTYRSVTVDRYGRVLAATNPTTVDGYGLTDVYT
ncbi:phage tail protein, partial [Pseudomonas mosselii]|uniref:phage tail protein n=1 Tax=Pseudomonas mosselii TaxID=78327 RepID=UPI0018D8B687